MVWAKDQMSCEWGVLVGSMMVMILAVYRIIHSTSLISLLVSLIAKQLAYLQRLMVFLGDFEEALPFIAVSVIS